MKIFRLKNIRAKPYNNVKCVKNDLIIRKETVKPPGKNFNLFELFSYSIRFIIENGVLWLRSIKIRTLAVVRTAKQIFRSTIKRIWMAIK